MAWILPVYDRTDQSYYNKSDIDRLNNNITYLKDLIEAYTSTILVPATTETITKKSFGRASLINTIESNINLIKDYLGYSPLGWVTLTEDWISKVYDFVFTNANNLERNLELLNIELTYIVTFLEYYRCGSPRIICGGGFPIF